VRERVLEQSNLRRHRELVKDEHLLLDTFHREERHAPLACECVQLRIRRQAVARPGPAKVQEHAPGLQPVDEFLTEPGRLQCSVRAREIILADLLRERLPIDECRSLKKAHSLVAIGDVFDDERVGRGKRLAHLRRQLGEARVRNMHRSVYVARRDACFRNPPQHAFRESLAGAQARGAGQRDKRKQQPRRQARGTTHRNTS
jgi:hypothetical protein